MSKTLNKIPQVQIDQYTIAQGVSNIYDLVKIGSLIYFYDDELDQLYITPKKGITKGYNLISVNQEMSVYINNKSKFGGVMISYFNSNLTSHDDLFKKYKQIFTRKVNGGKTIPSQNKEQIKNLTLSIMAELEKSVLNNKAN